MASSTTTTTSGQSDSPSPSPNKKVKEEGKSYSQKFREKWLTDEKYAQWLRRDPADLNKGKCSVCGTSFVSKRSNLDDHAKGLKHLKRMKERLEPITPANRKPIEQVEVQTPKKTSKAKEKMRAEIKLGAWAAEHNIPSRAFDHFPDVLAKTLSDSKVAQSLHLKRTKVSNVMTNVIGQGFIEDTEKEITCSAKDRMGKRKYSVTIDVTTDRSAGEKQLAVIIKYFDGPVMKTRLLDIVSVADGDAESLFQALSFVITKKGLDWSDCVGWCADTSDVMHGDQDSVKTRLMSVNPHMAAVNRSWHSAALVASQACEVFPGSLEKLVHNVYNYFAHSNKRTAAFKTFQLLTDTEPHKLLKPRQTQWLSLSECITRLLEQWDALLMFMHAQDLSETESDTQACGILAVMRDPYTKIYLEFLSFALPKILAFNKTLESSGSTIHMLADTLRKLYSDILSLYMEPAFIQQCRSLADIDPSNEALMLPLESTYIGVAAFQSLTTLNSTNQMKIEFLQMCRAFLVTTCEEMKNQFPLSDPLLIAASKLNMESVRTGHVTSFVSEILPHFPGVIADKELQRVDDLWRQIPYKEDLSADLDFLHFWQKVFSNEHYDPLSYCVKAIMLVPVANADCEQIFSELRQIKCAQSSHCTADSLMKLAAAREGIRETGCADFEPSKTMYQKFKKSGTLYARQVQEGGDCKGEQN
ncbi:uncharacterized protein LOC119737452 [Patiria miniata]|uniref:HAT C-terminal dimerisation domain-containing protein n=1 Tax=Patiria miniata TaxID=46514 RepID=A0A914AVM4_PATMI|nr:uncharacterized protein LOC119737452 [Patiria miniata]